MRDRVSRGWTRGLVIALAGISWGGAGAQAADGPPRPNILWITCEDTSPDLGCYGDPYARTPVLDHLAGEGARFRRAFTTAGVCAPSRSCIITGMYPASIGTQHMRSQGVPPPYVKCFPEYLRSAGYYCTNNAKTDYNFDPPPSAWDESSPRAHWRNRAKGQPFFAVFNFTVSHEAQVRAPEATYRKNTARLTDEQRHDPAKAVLPPYYPDTPEVRKDWARCFDDVTAVDYLAGDVLKQLDEDGLRDDTIVFFYGDHGRGLPRAKRWVYDSGIHIPLIVRWPGKIAPGTVRDELVSAIDFAPTVLALAGVPVPGHFQGQVFLGEKAAPPRTYVHAARDRMDETYDIIRAVRDSRYKYIRNFQPGKPYAQYIDYMEEMPTMKAWRKANKAGTLVGPQKLFFAPEKPVEELYDTEADPHEVENLAGRPKSAQIMTRMRAEMERWMASIRDLGLIPEDELKERMRPGGVWSVVARPEGSISSGASPSPRVSLTCPTEGASIVYTTDPSEKPSWRLYTGPFVPDRGAKTLRAKACRLGWRDSPEAKVELSAAP